MIRIPICNRQKLASPLFVALSKQENMIVRHPLRETVTNYSIPSSSARGWLVVHTGSRDNYQLPLALEECGELSAFVTDWYSKLTPLQTLLPGSLKNSAFYAWLSRRNSEHLPDNLIVDHKIAFTGYALGRKLKLSVADYHHSNTWIGNKAGRLATRLGSNLLSTSYYGAGAFRSYRGHGLKVLLQVHPSPRFLRRTYESFLQKGDLYQGLLAESEMTASDEQLETWEDECRLADTTIVSSSFSEMSLTPLGISSDSIKMVPYGTDLGCFKPAPPRKISSSPRVLFVGSKTARKGLHVLLEAWSRLAPRKASLRIAGANDRDTRILDAFPRIGEELPRLSRSELTKEFQEADLFVMPSLAEGFGHVYLESLACGTPIIGTENSAVPDFLRLGDCGFAVPAGNVEALASLLDLLLSQPKRLQDMRASARLVAEQYSWAHFRSKLRDVLLDAEQRRN